MSLRDQLSAVNSKIAHYREILAKLQDYQGRLNAEDAGMNSDYDPAESYDLTGGSDWAGAKELIAEDMRAQINGAFGSYDGEVGQLRQDIANAIANMESMIAAAEAEARELEIAIEEEDRREAEERAARKREAGR